VIVQNFPKQRQAVWCEITLKCAETFAGSDSELQTG